MDEGDKGRLNEILELTRENHRMIKKLHRAYWWGKVSSIIYWVIILGIAFGLFYYIKPYLGVLGEIITEIQETVQSVRGTADSVRGAF